MTRREWLGTSLAGAWGAWQAACGTQPVPSIGARNLAVYTRPEYHAPENVRAFASAHHIGVTFDFFDSQDTMLATLKQPDRVSSYDLVVSHVEFLPSLVEQGLLQPLDRSLIPNWSNQDPAMLALKDGPGGDPDGRYAAIKDWGATGFVYDETVVGEPLRSWTDFGRAAAGASVGGRVSVLPSPVDLLGLALWREASSTLETGSDSLARVERLLLKEMAPHIKAFDESPAFGLLSGEYALSQCWNGEARRAVMEAPDRLRWVLGTPRSRMWIAAWTVTSTSAHPETAHALIDFVLDPEVSAKEMAFTGHHTAVLGMEQFIAPELPARELILLTGEERARLVAQHASTVYSGDVYVRAAEIFERVRLAATRP